MLKPNVEVSEVTYFKRERKAEGTIDKASLTYIVKKYLEDHHGLDMADISLSGIPDGMEVKYKFVQVEEGEE